MNEINTVKFSFLLAVVMGLTACGGSDNNRQQAVYSPVVGVTFPPSNSTSTSDSVTVHAVALGVSNALTNVTASLNDVAIGDPVLPNEKNRYQFDVIGMTADSENSINVTASDADLSQSISRSVTYGSSWMAERGVQYDAINGRALVVDAAQKAVLAIDLETGEKTEVSGLNVGSGTSLIAPEDMALDANGIAWVVDSGLQQIVKIDLVTGDRSGFYDGSGLDQSNAFGRPIAVTLNGNATTAATTAYILDIKTKSIHYIRLSDGADETPPVSFTDEASGVTLRAPRDLIYDHRNVLDIDDDRLLITDRSTNRLIAISVSLDSSRSILSGAITPNTDNVFRGVQHVTLSADNSKAYISDAVLAAVVEVDLATGARTLLVDAGEIDGDDTVIRAANTDNPFASPSALTIGPNNQLLVVDNSFGVMVKVATEDSSGDLDYKGQRDYIAGGATTPAEGDTAATLTALTADHVMGRLSGLVSNANQSALYTIDRDLGEVKQLVPALNAVVPLYDLTSNTILGSNGELRFSGSGLLAALSSANTLEEDGTYADINSTGGSGSDAVFELTVNDGQVTAIQVTTTGESYAYGDTLTLGSSGNTDFSSLSLVLVNDEVPFTDPQVLASRFAVRLGPAGQLYAVNDRPNLFVSASSLSNLTEGDFSDISSNSNGKGMGAKFSVTVNGDLDITAIEVENAGTGYVKGEKLILAGEDFGASGSLQITLNEILQEIYVVNAATADSQGSVIKIDMLAGQGNRTLLPPSSSSDTAFKDPIAALTFGENLFVLDGGSGKIIQVALEEGLGDRTLLAAMPDARAMVLDETGENFYVASNTAIKKVSISDGTLSEHLTIDGAVNIVDLLLETGELFDDSDSSTLNSNDDRLLLLDAGLGKVFEVGLADTSPLDFSSDSALTGPTTPTSANPFVAPSKMIFHRNYKWLYVLDNVLRSVYAVDLRERQYETGSVEVDTQKVVIMQGTSLNKAFIE